MEAMWFARHRWQAARLLYSTAVWCGSMSPTASALLKCFIASLPMAQRDVSRSSGDLTTEELRGEQLGVNQRRGNYETGVVSSVSKWEGFSLSAFAVLRRTYYSYIHIYTHAHKHTHAHTHAHTHIYVINASNSSWRQKRLSRPETRKHK